MHLKTRIPWYTDRGIVRPPKSMAMNCLSMKVMLEIIVIIIPMVIMIAHHVQLICCKISLGLSLTASLL